MPRSTDLAVLGWASLLPHIPLQQHIRLARHRIVRPALTLTRLEDEGWSMRPATPGFRLVSCVRRQMEMPGEAATDPNAAPVLQTIYSDGLTYVSVFIERYRADRHTEPMFVSLGATVTFSQRQGDWWQIRYDGADGAGLGWASSLWLRAAGEH